MSKIKYVGNETSVTFGGCEFKNGESKDVNPDLLHLFENHSDFEVESSKSKPKKEKNKEKIVEEDNE